MIKNREIIFKTLLFLFALLINQYYGNRGLFPHDSASHFDTGYRVLLGDYPIKDYWIVSGFIIDYIQSFIFYLFGVNWQAYVLHASLFNGILAISLFFLFKHFGLKLENNLFFCFCFSILAYPSSGTPFVDHHSTFFSLLAVILTLFALETNRPIYWFFVPVLFAMSFLSKIVPAVYVILIILVITFLYILIFKNYRPIIYMFLGSSFSMIIFFLILKVTNTEFSNFWEQYIQYPQTIGLQRFHNLNIDLIKILSHFKFIFLSLVPILFMSIKNIFTKKKYFKDLKFYYFLILITFTFSLISHQVLTRNQTYIFFMIPVLLGASISFIKIKRPIIFLMIVFCLIVTFKYHMRFNENRKFHELEHAEFNKAEEAFKIDKKLSGLKWITPQFPEKPSEEINEIVKIKNILSNEKSNYMLLTNYSFFTAILEKNTLSTTRWHTFDDTDYPRKQNKYVRSYRNIIIKTINKNKVDKIYIIKPVTSKAIYNYIDKKCLVRKKILDFLVEHKLICKNL